MRWDNDLLEFYIKYRDDVITHLFKMGIGMDDALDICQDSFLILFEKIDNDKDFTLSFPKAYLFKIAKNNGLKFLRRKKTIDNQIKKYSILNEGIDPREKIEKQINTILISIEKLCERCQKILQYWSEGKSAKEIAKLLGNRSTQGIRNQISKCKKKLKGQVDSKNEIEHMISAHY